MTLGGSLREPGSQRPSAPPRGRGGASRGPGAPPPPTALGLVPASSRRAACEYPVPDVVPGLIETGPESPRGAPGR